MSRIKLTDDANQSLIINALVCAFSAFCCANDRISEINRGEIFHLSFEIKNSRSLRFYSGNRLNK